LVALLASACLADVDIDSTYIPTPIGPMLRDCVHRVPHGSLLEHEFVADMRTGRILVKNQDGQVQRVIPRCDTSKLPLLKQQLDDEVKAPGSRSLLQYAPDYKGWLAYTVYENPTTFTSALGYFSIPDAPQNPPDILYLFPGLQNIDWIPKVDPIPNAFDIIQPVLQYPGDNGNYWSVKSWYVTLDAGYMVSDEIQVNSGDAIWGNMTFVGPNTWYIGSTVNSTQQTTAITITSQDNRLSSQPWMYNTLECYGCVDCTTYPTEPIRFYDIQLFAGSKKVTANWKVTPKPPQQKFCTELAVVDDAKTVHINF
jgi:hypothetical protein